MLIVFKSTICVFGRGASFHARIQKHLDVRRRHRRDRLFGLVAEARNEQFNGMPISFNGCRRGSFSDQIQPIVQILLGRIRDDGIAVGLFRNVIEHLPDLGSRNVTVFGLTFDILEFHRDTFSLSLVRRLGRTLQLTTVAGGVTGRPEFRAFSAHHARQGVRIKSSSNRVY